MPSTVVFYGGTKKTLMFLDIAQIGSQILRCNQIQFIQRTGFYLRSKAPRIMLHIRDKLLIDIAGAFFEQVIYRFVMQIEGGAVDTGRGADFLDGDVCEVLLFQKRQKRLIHFRGGSEIFAFGFGQRETSSLREASAERHEQRFVSS